MTTGRINQVATLRDVSRAGPCGRRTRASLRRIESNRSFGTCGDRGPEGPRHAPHPREQQHPTSQTRRPSRQEWIAGAASWSSEKAPSEAPDGHGTMSGRSVPPAEGGGREFNASNYQRGCSNYPRGLQLRGSREQLRWIACQPFDARARSQPTRAIRSPLTRPRAFRTNADGRTTPRECMAAREQVEASEGVDSSPLSMHTITSDMKPTSEGQEVRVRSTTNGIHEARPPPLDLSSSWPRMPLQRIMVGRSSLLNARLRGMRMSM